MREPLETIRAFVDAFVAAWPSGNASAVAEFFSDDAVYHNGPFEPVTGRAEIAASLEAMMSLGGCVSVDLLHVVVNGDVVMTERRDSITADGRSAELPVLGVFELRGERIAAWRDYFDVGQFDAQWSSGR